jgi:hypothetical protein
MPTRLSNPFTDASSADEPDLHAPTRLRVEHLCDHADTFVLSI